MVFGGFVEGLFWELLEKCCCAHGHVLIFFFRGHGTATHKSGRLMAWAIWLALVALAAGGAGAEAAWVGSKRTQESVLCFAASPLHRTLLSPGACALRRPAANRAQKSALGVSMQQMDGKRAGGFDLLSGKDFDLLALRSVFLHSTMHDPCIAQSAKREISCLHDLAADPSGARQNCGTVISTRASRCASSSSVRLLSSQQRLVS